jgi:predicted DNA-binding transcriptional regulator AlpA
MKHKDELTPIEQLIARLRPTHPELADALAEICARDPEITGIWLLAPMPSDDDFLDATESAKVVKLSKPAFWKAVRDLRLPAPVYPAPRAPRWLRGELRMAALATRAMPAVQMAARRQKKLEQFYLK